MQLGRGLDSALHVNTSEQHLTDQMHSITHGPLIRVYHAVSAVKPRETPTFNVSLINARVTSSSTHCVHSFSSCRA